MVTQDNTPQPFDYANRQARTASQQSIQLKYETLTRQRKSITQQKSAIEDSLRDQQKKLDRLTQVRQGQDPKLGFLSRLSFVAPVGEGEQRLAEHRAATDELISVASTNLSQTATYYRKLSWQEDILDLVSTSHKQGILA